MGRRFKFRIWMAMAGVLLFAILLEINRQVGGRYRIEVDPPTPLVHQIFEQLAVEIEGWCAKNGRYPKSLQEARIDIAHLERLVRAGVPNLAHFEVHYRPGPCGFHLLMPIRHSFGGGHVYRGGNCTGADRPGWLCKHIN